MTLKSSKPPADLARAEQAIVKLAAAYPEVREDRPWGHRAFKIRNKTFLFLQGADADGLSLSVKLPESGVMALELPFTEPTHYGLGKSGWVSASFKSGKDVPLALVKEWLDESFSRDRTQEDRRFAGGQGELREEASQGSLEESSKDGREEALRPRPPKSRRAKMGT